MAITSDMTTCPKCGNRMSLRHIDSLVHRCPNCGEEERSSYVIPESKLMD